MERTRRIGAFVCRCGQNIAATVDTARVAAFAGTLPGVVVAREYLFLCSDPGQGLIRDTIREHGLNRVVVASCSPLMHERTFRRVCSDAGINPFLFEMANIREHCSWVHEEGATAKAKSLVRAAVMRVRSHQPLRPMEVPITPHTLVVGGGIAGMQAALDIANAGYKVTLVEREASIGGRMIQLDKTFPTLDCSACITTPKMSEVGSHPHIDLLNYSGVESMSGSIGNFRVTIRKRAKYVDPTLCNGCRLCIDVCPVSRPSEFDMRLRDRKAIDIPFPQAVPNKAVIEKRDGVRCKSACVDACPVHTNVPGYIHHIREGRYDQAYELIRRTNPLPAVCGRVCHAPCEAACNRGQIDMPLAIRMLKRSATDHVELNRIEGRKKPDTGKRVAVVGGGPGGLAAAHDLALAGHAVTLYEALPEAGGMLLYAIPEYRLPKQVVRQEIDFIKRLGVDIRTNTQVGRDINFETIRDDYDAVFLALGCQRPMRLNVPGEDLAEVMEGIEFLRAVSRGDAVRLGDAVAVIGGGDTAIDCARTAKRLGAGNVTVIYRRTRHEMPSSVEEVEAATSEGIQMEFLAVPIRFVATGGRLSGALCRRMELGDRDADGRRRPVPIEGSDFEVPLNTVIVALGQEPETESLSAAGLSLAETNRIEIDPATGATTMAGVFAGGDVVTGPAFVIDAIAAGRRAAGAIDRYLGCGEDQAWAAATPGKRLSEEEVRQLRRQITPSNRVSAGELPIAHRGDFREVVQCLSPEADEVEASRCLAGQYPGCIECRECRDHCEPGAIDLGMRDEVVAVDAGSVILATGYDPFDPSVMPQYGYGVLEDVVTGLEFERLSSASGPTQGRIQRRDGREPESVAILHCVGSRDKNFHEYCSRVCCMVALKFAYLIREKTRARVYQMYIDMRCFGQGYEEFYERLSAEKGIRFIRGKASRVTNEAINDEEQGRLVVLVEDTLLGELLRVPVDMVVLANALQPRSDASRVANLFSVGRRADGFFMSRHVKLDPMSTLNDGIFMAGCCEGPKDIPDTIAQAKAAAAQSLSLLARGKIEIEPIVASIDEEVCSGCRMCEPMCPYGALSLVESHRVMSVNPAQCKGCGSCAVTCLSGAATLSHFTPRQILDQVEALTY